MKSAELIELLKRGQKAFLGIDIEGSFINKDLSGITFENCYITADFTGANLTKTTFRKCNLKTCIFCYAILDQATFEYNCLEATDFRFVQYSCIALHDNTCYSSVFDISDLEEAKAASYPGFHILRVYSGWFEAIVVNKSSCFVITASDYLGNDAPTEFLKALIELCESSTSRTSRDVWLCWDEEPGAFIWKLTRINERIRITIFGAKRNSDDIAGLDRKSLEKEEVEEIFIEAEGLFIGFLKEVIRSFEKIRYCIGIQKYENEWGSYPQEELERLKYLVRELNECTK